MNTMLNYEDNLRNNLKSFLSEYDPDTRNIIIDKICYLVKNEENIEKFNSQKFNVKVNNRQRWHDIDNNGLYFNMDLSYKQNGSKLDLILNGTYVCDYDNGYDFGVQLKKTSVRIPVNYRPKNMGILSYLMGWR